MGLWNISHSSSRLVFKGFYKEIHSNMKYYAKVLIKYIWRFLKIQKLAACYLFVSLLK